MPLPRRKDDQPLDSIQLSVSQVLEIEKALTTSSERLRELHTLTTSAIRSIEELGGVVDKLKDSQSDLKIQHTELSTRLRSFPEAQQDIESIDREVRAIQQTLAIAQKRMDGLSQAFIAMVGTVLGGLLLAYFTGQSNKAPETPKKSIDTPHGFAHAASCISLNQGIPPSASQLTPAGLHQPR
jgi:hypothetical protein